MKRFRNAQKPEQTLTFKQLLTGPRVQTHDGVVFGRISKPGGLTIISNAPLGQPQKKTKPGC